MNSLYLDMDGVVADFDGYAHQKLGIGPSEGKYPQNVWEILIENPRLYRDLKPTPYATQLYDFCHKIAKKLDYRVAFLTAIPKKNDVQYAMHDKVEWAQKHFPGTPVFFGPYSRDKQNHCYTGDILIDDRTDNIQEWKDAGGVGILHKDYDVTVKKLKGFVDFHEHLPQVSLQL
jgi:5'(3')-deoxyribonucleotidase